MFLFTSAKQNRQTLRSHGSELDDYLGMRQILYQKSDIHWPDETHIGNRVFSMDFTINAMLW